MMTYLILARKKKSQTREKTGDPVQTITNLMKVVDLINKWMKKNIKDIQKGVPEKVQIADELQKLVHLEGVAAQLGSDLAALLVQGTGYTLSPTPLFT
ncbi:hypothetical protein [Crocosphaera sp.]|uniref:hypothetical protein n=1 Tax=Crocosphaera sp. TaxID=2729996 RepID=UPI003F23C997|nr:hypothetical protein [Crocosphaera sp.]